MKKSKAREQLLDDIMMIIVLLSALFLMRVIDCNKMFCTSNDCGSFLYDKFPFYSMIVIVLIFFGKLGLMIRLLLTRYSGISAINEKDFSSTVGLVSSIIFAIIIFFLVSFNSPCEWFQ